MSDSPSPNDVPSGFLPARIWARLREHKVLQWSLAYLGAALAVGQAHELLAAAFDWPPVAARITMGLLVVGFPLAITLAWYHGHRAMRSVSQGELLIFAVLLLMAGGFFAVFVHESPRTGVEQPGSAAASSQTPAPPRDPARPRIAILPFENLSPDPDNAFFTDGLHEEIIGTLANRARGLEVLSRTTMMLYRRAPKPAPEIGRELGATYVLEGSVRRDGTDVRLTLQLIDARTDVHVWSKNFDRQLVKAMSLQSEVASEVAAELSVELLGGSRSALVTSSVEAYDLYLKASLAYDNVFGGTRLADLLEMDRSLQRALMLDPAFAGAHLLRARVRFWMFATNLDVSEQSVAVWRTSLEAAARIAPDDLRTLAEQMTYAYFVDRSADRTSQILARATALGGSEWPTAPMRMELLTARGQTQEAIDLGRRFFASDPNNPLTGQIILGPLYFAHEDLEVARMMQRGDNNSASIGAWWATGDRARLAQFVSVNDAFLRGQDLGIPIDREFVERSNIDAAFGLGDYAMGRAIIAAAKREAWHESNFDLSGLHGVGSYPTAGFLGWFDLLENRRADAARNGDAVLQYVARTPATPWNAWYLRILTAQGHLFRGEQTAAVQAAREAIAMKPCSADQKYCTVPALFAAQVFAWAGEADEAVPILERLGIGVPGLAPVHIARDSRVTVPLAGNARYKALKAQLETRMAATKKALEAH